MLEERVRFVEMNQHHLDGAARVLTRSFLELNDIWKTLKPTYDEVFPIIRGKILPALKSGWSFVLVPQLRSCSKAPRSSQSPFSMTS